jgi:hypothetical protein
MTFTNIKSGVFFDGIFLDAVPEVLSQKDASRNGVPEPFFLASVQLTPSYPIEF